MEQNVNPDEQQSNLFDSHIEYVQASQGIRFLNFLIDNLFMQYGLGYLTGYMLGYLLLIIAPDFLASISDEGALSFLLLSVIIGYFNYIVYYTFCEFAFKGYTLGKLITRTKAIRDDGNPLTFRDAILRSLSRIVPFEPFSALGGSLWHDRWTKTTVIKVR